MRVFIVFCLYHHHSQLSCGLLVDNYSWVAVRLSSVFKIPCKNQEKQRVNVREKYFRRCLLNSQKWGIHVITPVITPVITVITLLPHPRYMLGLPYVLTPPLPPVSCINPITYCWILQSLALQQSANCQVSVSATTKDHHILSSHPDNIVTFVLGEWTSVDLWTLC